MMNKYIECDYAKLNLCGCNNKRLNFCKILENKVIYWENPKCASTYIKKNISHRQAKLQDLEKKSFSIVRNPYNRVFSNYKMFILDKSRLKTFKSFSKIKKDNISIIDFIKFTTDKGSINHHMLPQSCFIPEKVDYIIKLESIDNLSGYEIKELKYTFPKIKNKTGATSSKYDIKDFIGNEAKEMIISIYEEDFIRFGYDFEYM